MYNTNLISENDLPKSLVDLTDAKWKGKIEVLIKFDGDCPIVHNWQFDGRQQSRTAIIGELFK